MSIRRTCYLIVGTSLVLATSAGFVAYFLYPSPRPGDTQLDGGDDKNVPAGLTTPAHHMSVDDLERFRPGRSKKDILNDIQWRAGWVEAYFCEGRSVMTI